MKTHLIYIILGFLACACAKDVKIDIPGYQEKLVIDGFIETGYPPIVMLSNSKDIYDPTDLNSYLNNYISDATISVSNGSKTVQLMAICTDDLPAGTEQMAADLFGVPVQNLTKYHLCAYTTFDPEMRGKVGETYNLTVNYHETNYTSSVSIESPKKLDFLYWKPADGYTNYGYSWAKLTDNPTSYDAYLWEVKRINKDKNGKPKDNIFTKPYNPIFDDKFINGITFDFYFENPMSVIDTTYTKDQRGFYRKGDTVVVKFSKMNRSVYDFLEKKYMQVQTQGNPFATPINLPSNITGGALGLWAGYSPSYDTLICF